MVASLQGIVDMVASLQGIIYTVASSQPGFHLAVIFLVTMLLAVDESDLPDRQHRHTFSSTRGLVY